MGDEIEVWCRQNKDKASATAAARIRSPEINAIPAWKLFRDPGDRLQLPLAPDSERLRVPVRPVDSRSGGQDQIAGIAGLSGRRLLTAAT